MYPDNFRCIHTTAVPPRPKLLRSLDKFQPHSGQLCVCVWRGGYPTTAPPPPPPPPPPPCFPPPLTCSSSPPPPPYFIFPRKLFTSLMASRRIRLSMNESQPASTLAKQHITQSVSWHLPTQQSQPHHMHHQLQKEHPKS